MEKENHILQLNDGPFESIKNRLKTIEMRLFDQKRKKIQVGDIIKFVKRSNNADFIFARVKNLYLFNDFKTLYKNFDQSSLGYKSQQTARPEDMAQYYSENEIEKYGVVGIEIEVI